MPWLDTDGTILKPAFGFSSETSLGLYRSGVSTLAVSYGTTTFNGMVQVKSLVSFAGVVRSTWQDVSITTFANNLSDYALIFRDPTGNNALGLSIQTTTPTVCLANGNGGYETAFFNGANERFRVGSNYVTLTNVDLRLATRRIVGVFSGSSIDASFAYSSETSLGFYRSGVSHVGLTYGGFSFPAGSALIPAATFSSESSLGLYRSGVSTVALSYGTLNLATQGVRLSMRTIAASAVTVSAAKTNVAVDEAVFTVGGASGASFCIYSGGTVYIFNSALSAAAS